MVNKHVPTGLLAVALMAVSVVPASAAGDRVRLLGEATLPPALEFEGTTVGGLSGLDYDERTGQWLLISDDRSAKQPARFYTADIGVGVEGVGGVELTGTRPLLRPDGTPYPPLPDGTAVDPEEIRVDPWTGRLWWTSEGERSERLIDPAVRSAEREGAFRAELPLPPNLPMDPAEGPRHNEVLEGLTFAAGGSLVVSSVEGPLIQDGESPTVEHGALGRITVQSRRGAVVSQYAYPMEKVFASSPTGGFSNNGVSAILAADDADPFRFLVMERSFVTGVGNSVRIYEVDTRGATDVKDVHSLRGTDVRPVRKRLLADLASLGLARVDNVEGMAWGPRLPSDERSLVLVSDDNFSAGQVTQIIALAVR